MPQDIGNLSETSFKKFIQNELMEIEYRDDFTFITIRMANCNKLTLERFSLTLEVLSLLYTLV